MNRRTLRATGIVLTGMLLAGDPVSMIYAAPVAGVSVATTAEAVAVGTGSSSPSAGVSLAVADCLVASNEEVAQEAAAQQELDTANTTLSSLNSAKSQLKSGIDQIETSQDTLTDSLNSANRAKHRE